MLNIYFGRENMNKNKFIFEKIKDNTLLIVPNQATLQAEKDAFAYRETKGLFDLQVLSFNRLASMVLTETGGARKHMINKMGRHMLLSKILKEEEVNLKTFEKYCSNNSFIELANNFISELKQYSVEPFKLDEAIESVSSRPTFQRKLRDLSKIYHAYEEQIEEKYIDTEDYVNIFCDKIKESKKIKENIFWVNGFDYFAPKNFQILEEIEKNAIEVNIVLTYDESEREDVFAIGKSMLEKFKKNFSNIEIHQISPTFIEEKIQAIQCLEKNIFAIPSEKCQNNQGIIMCYATNYYSEGETAAVNVVKLIKEKGYRYNEIAIVCNDLNVRGNIYKRVFEKYGIKLFVDAKRDIMHSPATKYLKGLFNVLVKGYRKEDVLRLAKTRLSPLSDEEINTFEEYINFYRISGKKIKEDFTKKGDKFEEEDLHHINNIRDKIISPIISLGKELKEGKGVEDKVKALYSYLALEANIPNKLKALIEEQNEDGEYEHGEETGQVWNKLVQVFEQLIEIIGEETISVKTFSELFMAGIESIEIGLLPPTVDGLIMGTMQRTRIGDVKALFVLGANEGVLPAVGQKEELLSEEEKMLLKEDDFEFSKLESLRIQEENLAIYKNLSRPEELLYISCAASDEGGAGLKPSNIFNKVKETFDMVPKEDIIASGSIDELIVGPDSTAYNLVRELRASMKGKAIDKKWKAVMSWYWENQKEKVETIEEGVFFENKRKNIDRNQGEKIYLKSEGDDFDLSPSRIERFGKCPFAHFVNYGLKAKEIREYKIEALDMGDLYHLCLMELSNTLSEEKAWTEITYEECAALIEEIFDSQIKGYRENLFFEGAEEKYRSKKIKEICTESAWIMITHVRKGLIEEIKCEVSFGKGCEIEPIKLENHGQKIFISGIIDRLDLLPENAIKIIDYKSGNDEYNVEEALYGVKLQLFIYMHASENIGRKPVGAFYFHIKDPMLEVKNKSLEERISLEVEKSFRMDGVLIGEEKYTSSMDSSDGKKSHIIPSKSSRDIEKFGIPAGKVLTEEKFQELRDAVKGKVIEMTKELVEGNIDIAPRQIKDNTSCKYCNYKGICKFDVTLPGFNYKKEGEKL